MIKHVVSFPLLDDIFFEIIIFRIDNRIKVSVLFLVLSDRVLVFVRFYLPVSSPEG